MSEASDSGRLDWRDSSKSEIVESMIQTVLKEIDTIKYISKCYETTDLEQSKRFKQC
jgi:hypothetical protein